MINSCFKPLLNLSKQNKQVHVEQLHLKNTLLNGQCFNWQKIENNETNQHFQGVLKGNYYEFMEKDKKVFYKSLSKNNSSQDLVLLNDYFNLEVDFQEHIKQWNECDEYFSKVSPQLEGVRILKQHPWECLISFICSQNNNIPRIKLILHKLRSRYGELVYTDDQKNQFYSFPNCNQMLKITEADYSELGLGYRGKYLKSAVDFIHKKGGEDFLEQIKNKQDHKETRQLLISINGIGKKVADCIALFSLNCAKSVPVDTHVWQIYMKKYNNQSNMKLTATNYDKVSLFFQDTFGDKAGWAHCWLFMADLREFQDQLKQKEQKKKLTKKQEKEKGKNEQKVEKENNKENMEIEQQPVNTSVSTTQPLLQNKKVQEKNKVEKRVTRRKNNLQK